MHHTDADVVTVDVLEDVDLAARRPLDAGAVRLAHEPEGGPDTLLVGRVGAPDAQTGLETGDSAGLGGEGVLALDAAASPASSGTAVSAGGELQTTGTVELNVVKRSC